MTSKSDQSSTWADQVLAETYRADWGRLLSLLVARTRRLDLAEDALSEAFARAGARWPTAGVPANPGGWLYTTAARLVVGQLRSEAIHGRKVQLLAVGTEWSQSAGVDDIDDLDDERLALVLRRNARTRDGQLVTLADQDRSLWHKDQIRAGVELIAELPAGAGYAEELRLQGLIAVEHASASTASDTEWSTISTLYARLETVTGSPIVRLNRAVAVGEAEGPHAGLAVLTGLDDTLANNHRLHAVRADLARRAGNNSLARDSYTAALELCTNEVERQHLADRLDALGH